MPDDAAVVIVAGPQTDFFPPEIEALKKYLDKAGKLLLELDPPDKADSPPLTNLIALAHDWGIDVGNNIVVDVERHGTADRHRRVGAGRARTIRRIRSPSASASSRRSRWRDRSTPVTGGVNGHTAQTFVETEPAQLGGNRHQGAADDRQGVARRGEGRQEGAGVDRRRRVGGRRRPPTPPKPGDSRTRRSRKRASSVIGDSDFAANGGARHPGQPRPVHEHVGWLSQQENLISIRPKEPDDRRITLTDDQQKSVMLFALIGLPVAIFGLGVYGWARRRG